MAESEIDGSGGVQSVNRALLLLESMADLGGVATLSRLQEVSGLPLPTIHRLLRTLLVMGYVRRQKGRDYALGPRLVRLGEYARLLVGATAEEELRTLVEEVGESANLAVLDGDQVLYVAHAPGRHAMRMFTEVGRRAWVHCTAVGKAMLAEMDPGNVDAILLRSGMPAQTSRTITDPVRMRTELETVRKAGFAVDNGEQEDGVRCVAVVLRGDKTRAAVSISGPVGRVTDKVMREAVPLLHEVALRLSAEWEAFDNIGRK